MSRSVHPGISRGAELLRPGAQKTVCVAVTGTGSIGVRHLEVFRGLGAGVRPVAIPKRPERRDELEAAGFSTARDLEGAVRMGASLCVIASDTGRHTEDAGEALERGLDILVEKPLAVDAGEARRLCTRAAALGRQLFVGCVLRFSESLQVFRHRLEEVGRLHAVRIECRSYLPDWRPQRAYQASYSARADEGGVLRDLIHEIDYAGWIFGWPAALQARVRNLGRLGIEAEEIAELTWQTSDGALVSVGLDYLSRPPQRRVTACGERGIIAWDGVTGMVRVTTGGAPAEELRPSQGRDEAFRAQALAFIQARGRIADPGLATGEDGVRALAICDAARQASASQREEQVVCP